MLKRRKRFLRIVAVVCAVCMLFTVLISVFANFQGLF